MIYKINFTYIFILKNAIDCIHLSNFNFKYILAIQSTYNKLKQNLINHKN